MAEPPPSTTGHLVGFAPLFPIEAWEGLTEVQLRCYLEGVPVERRSVFRVEGHAIQIIKMVHPHPFSFPGARHVIETILVSRVSDDRAWKSEYAGYMMRRLAGMSYPDDGPSNRAVRFQAFCLLARLTESEITRLRQYGGTMSEANDPTGATQRQSATMLTALAWEETRRANRTRYLADTRDRGVMMQTNIAEAFASSLPGGRDVFNHIIAPMVSGHVTARRDPTRPNETGPLPSRRDMLAQLSLKRA